MRHVSLSLIVAALTALGCSAVGRAADPTEIDQLKNQIEQLDQKLRILERKRELEQESATEKAKSAPSVSLGSSGLEVRTADSNFVFRVRGYVQVDGRFYLDDYAGGTANDTFLIRRARPIFDGTVYERFDYRVMLDFASGVNSSTGNNGFLQDAYVNARLWPELQIQAGKFKEPVGLERLQSGANLLFVERGYPTLLVPNRDVGVQLQGDVSEAVLSYAVGVFNGVADGGSGDMETADDEKDVAARVFLHPFRKSNLGVLKGLGLGVAGTYGNQDGALRTYVTPGQQRFFAYRTGAGTNAATANVMASGDHWRVSPQAYYYRGPFGLFGEYVISNQELERDAGVTTMGRVRNTAWLVAASWFLTGEQNSSKPVAPKHPVDLHGGGWGALELAARVQQLHVDDAAFPVFANPATSAREAFSWGVGLNWHLNRNVKLNLDYEQTDFKGGDASDVLRAGENVILARVQFSF